MEGKPNKQNILLFVNTGKTPYLKSWNGKFRLLSVFKIIVED